jgi:hypothetical protein
VPGGEEFLRRLVDEQIRRVILDYHARMGEGGVA